MAGSHRSPEQRVDPLDRHAHLQRGRRLSRDDDRIGGNPEVWTGQGNELSEPLDRPLDDPRIGALREASSSLGPQRQATTRPGDGDRVEGGGFEEDIGRRIADLRGCPSHDSGDSDHRVLGVADHAINPGVSEALAGNPERSLDSIEGGERFAYCCLTNPKSGARDSCEVIGVSRLAKLEHHVVRCVDDVVDGSHASERQSASDPLWRGPHLDPTQDRNAQTRAQPRIDDLGRHDRGRCDAARCRSIRSHLAEVEL